jgi:hypothetical protein
MTYGISMDMFPAAGGNFPLDYYRNWIAQRLKVETMETANDKPDPMASPVLDILDVRNWDAFVALDGHILPRLGRDMDKLVAKELNAMSTEEREHSFKEIHGICDAVHETSEFVKEKLAKLDGELANISKHQTAYLLAETQDEAYVKSTKLRLKFLRADSFDVEKAAERLVMFFEEKLNLFGIDLLAKDVKMSDLDEDEIRCLKSGVGQLFPRRDRGGRCVFAWNMAFGVEDGASDIQAAKTKVSRYFHLRMAWNTTFIFLLRYVISGACLLLRADGGQRRRRHPNEGGRWSHCYDRQQATVQSGSRKTIDSPCCSTSKQMGQLALLVRWIWIRSSKALGFRMFV